MKGRRTWPVLGAYCRRIAPCHSMHRFVRTAARPAPKEIRLTKRMSELDICSRREGERLIIENKVLVKGVPAIVGMKVADNETDIVVTGSSPQKCAAVVLHKPVGYVSGQPEHGNVPAVKLLTKENAVGKVDDLFENDGQKTVMGFSVAGRLDRDSSGLLVFCHSGVVAKKLVSSMGYIPKEYVVTLQPACQPTREEKNRGLTSLPRPTLDLQILKKGGGHLLGDPRPLKSIRAKWIDEGEILRLILREGRQRQIRRMCRQLLGFHVVSLQRTGIGPIDLKDLPVGKWRPLTKKEVDEIISRN